MNTILNFVRAVAPYIAIVVILALFWACSSAKKKKDKRQESNYGTEGLSLGMCFGLLIGTMLENSTGIGISLGMFAGLVIGILIPKHSTNEDK